MTEELGRAELETGVNLAGLDKDLVKAEARVARFVAVTQAMLDSLHADVNVKLNQTEALADKLAASTARLPGAGGSPVVVEHRPGGSSGVSGLVGIRGPNQAGSLNNPLVFVQAAAKYYPMGSYGAAIGEDNAADAQRGDQSSGVASAADMAALTQAVSELASNAAPGAQLATAGGNGLTEPGGGERTAAALDRQNSDALSRAAAALDRQTAHASTAGGRGATVIHADRVEIQGAAGSGPAAFGAKGSSSSTGGAPFAYGAGGAGGGRGGGPPIATGFPGGAGGGGGGNRRVDIYHHSDGGSGGGGGGRRIMFNPLRGTRSEPDTGNVFSLANLFKGDQGRGGAFGLPGFGSIGSLAGLGLEHWILTALGVGASATAAVGGAGLLGTAGLTQALVGSGSNALVNKATESQIAATTKDFYALQTAIAEYGKGSKQAVAAQNLLNYSIKQMGAAAPAELKVFQDVKALHTEFEKDSTAARTQAAENMDQIVKLGTVFTPLVTAAAARNLGIINTGLRPLFQWLEGPQGIGIFQDLEDHFAKDLPVSIHAFDMAIEDFLRLMDVTVQYTGGLSRSLDNLFTAKNGESTQQYRDEVEKLVGDFDRWKLLVHVLGQDLRLLFRQDAGTANSIVTELIQMLVKLGDWERSTTGQTQLQNIFYVHKQEILTLLHLLEPLGGAYTHFYMDVAPPLVSALTGIAGAIDKILSAIEKIPGGADALGLGLVLAKLGILSKLGPGLMTTAKALGLIKGGEAAAGAAGAAAGAGGGAAEGAGAGAAAGLLSKIPGVGAWGASAIAAVATAAIPYMIAGGAVVLLTKAFESGPETARATPGRVQGPQVTAAGRGRPVNMSAVGTERTTSVGTAGLPLDIQAIGKFSNYSAEQLKQLIKEIHQAGSIKLNGVNETKQEVLELANAALKVKEKWNEGFNSAWRDVNQFFRNTGTGLAALQDDFHSNINRIVDTVGTGSAAGRKLMATNVDQMVLAVTQGMIDGKISVTKGMAAINAALRTGVQAGAVSWEHSWQSMFDSVSLLYNLGRISTKQYASDVRSIMRDGDQRIRTDNRAAYEGIVSDLKTQLDRGQITHQQFVERVHAADQQMGVQAKTDMSAFAAQIVGGFASVTSAGGQGLQDLIKSVNSALKLLGQAPLTGLQVSVLSTNAANTTPGGQKHGASGGLFQIGRPGEAGRDSVLLNMGGTEIVVAPGEQAIIANRHQIPMLNYAVARAFGVNGLPGFFAANNKPNYMAAGGFVPDPGTNFTFGQEPQIAGNLNRLAEKLGVTIYGISGYRSPAHSVAVGGFSDDPHTRGQAADIGVNSQLRSSAAQISTALLHRFGLDRPFDESDDPSNSEVNHIQLLGSLASAGGARGAGGTLGALLSTITAPQVKGGGTLGKIVHAALGMVAKGANKYLGARDVSAGGSTSMAGIAPGSWLQVARQLAKRFGWGPGQIQAWQGVENIEDGSYSLTATNPRSGAYGLAQGITGPSWYYGQGGNPNTLVGQLTAMANYIHGRYGTPAGALAHEHAAGWYASGGMVPGYASGGFTFPSSGAQDLAVIRQYMSNLNADVGPSGLYAGLQEKLNYWPQLWGVTNPLLGGNASSFVVTADALGNPVTPYIDMAGVQTTLGEESSEANWWGGSITSLRTGVQMAQHVAPLIRAAIKRRQDRIAKIKAQIRENLRRIADLRKQINTEQGKSPPYANPKNKDQRAANSSFYKQRREKINSLQNQIIALEQDNQRLGGDQTQVGTGGQIGALGNAISGLQTNLGDVTGSGQYSPLTLEGIGGIGGDLGGALIQQASIQQELAQLSPSSLQAALAAAQNGSSPPGASGTTASLNANPLTGTVGFSFQGQQYAASLGAGIGMALGGMVLDRMPPYGGIFHQGGVVPGPVGAERMILAKGGEIITDPYRAGSGSGGGGVASAIDELICALGDHAKAVAENTRATCANTSAVSSTGGSSRYSYGSAYAGSLSSDSIVNLGVGS